MTPRSDAPIVEVQVTGKLTHEDFVTFTPHFEELVEQRGRLRVLFEMADFHGWNATALWDEIKFDMAHFADIDRVAMVGDKKWEEYLSLLCSPFTRAHVRYFNASAVEDARLWLMDEIHPHNH